MSYPNKHLKDRTYINMINRKDYKGLIQYHKELSKASEQLGNVDSLNEHISRINEYSALLKDRL